MTVRWPAAAAAAVIITAAAELASRLWQKTVRRS